jgi:LacI family transcriptional regulator
MAGSHLHRVRGGKAPAVFPVQGRRAAGRDRATGELVRTALTNHPNIAAVYSIGGGNASIVQAFAELKRPCRVFIGHDVDNLELLRSRRISAVLRHDLRQDMRTACIRIMRAQGALPKSVAPGASNIQINTPFNMPA